MGTSGLKLAFHFAKPSERISDRRAGDAIRASELIAALRRADADVEVFQESENGSAALAARGYRSTLRRVMPEKGALALRDVGRIALSKRSGTRLGTRLAALRFDALIETHNCLSLAGVVAARRANIPLIIDDIAPPWEAKTIGGMGVARLHSKAFRTVCDAGALLVAVTDAIRKNLLEFGVPAERIVLVPNGVCLDYFSCRDRLLDRKKFALTSANLVIAFVGSFQRYHDVPMLIRCFKRAAPAGAVLLLAGDGPTRAESASAVEDLGLTGRVVFLGNLPSSDVAAVLGAADIAVLPATNDYGNPMKLYEYMAASASIVAPRKPTVMEIVTDEITGLLFEPDNEDALTEALQRILGDGLLRSHLSCNARQEIAASSWDCRARSLNNRIAQVVKSYRAGRL